MMMERLLVVALLVGVGSALDNGLALTPPMGWLAWERFRCETDCKNFPDSCINDKLFMAMADKVVELGLKELGYVYINIDDCWLAKERDPNTGRLMPDPDRFPNGIKALADYIHGKGLKLGIYEDFGFETCAHYPGSEYYMQLDAQTFAEWEVDMLKFDGCNSNAADMHIGYPIMGKALNKTGRPILYSCEWPLYEWVHKVQRNYSAIRETCNMWRTFTDVTDYWQSILSIVDNYGNDKLNFSTFTGPGGWADPDMLVTGDYGLSYTQQKAQLGMWAMFAAPLFMSNDLRTIEEKPLQLLKNTHVIAINQDPLGIQAQRLFEIPGSISVWMKPLVQGNTALAFFNKFYEGRPTPLTIKLQDLGMKNAGGYNVTEVFDQQHMGMYKPSDDFSVLVDPTGILLLKLEPLSMK